MKSSFCIDLQRFMLIPTKFPLSQMHLKSWRNTKENNNGRQNIGHLSAIIYWLELFSKRDIKECIEQNFCVEPPRPVL